MTASTEITLREVYDVLVEVREDVTSMKVTMSDVRGDIADHEARIRALEKRVWSIAGIATVAGAALSQVVGSLFS